MVKHALVFRESRNNMSEELEQIENETHPIVSQVASHHLRAALKSLRLTAVADEHLARTPENVAEFWMEFFAPYLSHAAPPVIATFPAREMAGQCVLIKDLAYHSMCAHHLTPFFGEAHIAYVPHELGIGIGSPAKLLEFYARRPQLQERLAVQLADGLIAACQPRGVMVFLTARQMCMEMRGTKTKGVVECFVARGCFEEDSWRQLFFARLK